ncbi:MAG: nuclear transport factor 2 family protein [Planctomycetes bacterium]|nr:nuclear transport factor 2 family protein [Planctomycetota bacterium]
MNEIKKSERLEHALSYWKHETSGDLQGVLDHYAEDATFKAPGYDLSGKQEIKKFYETIMGSYATMKVEDLRTVEKGDDVVVEFGFNFERHNGEKGYAEGCNVFTIKDQQIKRVRAYFNPSEY